MVIARVAVFLYYIVTMNSRRHFLQTLLLASGATFIGLPLGCSEEKSSRKQPLTRAADPRPPLSTSGQRFAAVHKMLIGGKSATLQPSRVRTCDVAVIGAGPSGLTACRQLHKMGFETLLLDSEFRTGGAAVNGEWNGVKYPLGSVYLVEYEGLIKEMIAEAGATPLSTPDDALVLDNTVFTDFWKDDILASLPVSAADKEGMKRFRDDLLKLKVEPAYPLPQRLSPELAALDAQSSRDFLRQYSSPILESLLNSYSLSSMGGTLDETNAYCLLNFYGSEFGDTFGLPRYTFRGGLHEFAEIIARPIPAEVMLDGHIVFHVENTADGVTLLCIDDHDEILQIKAKAAVVAIQKFAVPFLVAGLPDVQKEAMKQLHYSPFATIHLCSNRALLPRNDFDTWALDTGNYFTDILNPSSLYPDDAKGFVHTLYSPRPISDRGMLMSDELFADFSRKAAEAALPILGGAQAAEAIQEIHCWAWGHSIVRAGVGTHNGPAQRASQPFGNIFFANTDNDASPAVENAVAHGARAAELIYKRLHTAVKGESVR